MLVLVRLAWGRTFLLRAAVNVASGKSQRSGSANAAGIRGCLVPGGCFERAITRPLAARTGAAVTRWQLPMESPMARVGGAVRCSLAGTGHNYLQWLRWECLRSGAQEWNNAVVWRGRGSMQSQEQSRKEPSSAHTLMVAAAAVYGRDELPMLRGKKPQKARTTAGDHQTPRMPSRRGRRLAERLETSGGRGGDGDGSDGGSDRPDAAHSQQHSMAGAGQKGAASSEWER
jgi:hypothetical protein